MAKGKLYGVGVGPGDPELLTLKAMRLMREADLIAVPHKDKDKCFALSIAAGAMPEVMDKDFLEIDMPMTLDYEKREQAYVAGTAKLAAALDEGKTVVFLVLGDPTVYSTYCYLHERIVKLGYETEIVPGITSFCASAAALNIPLCEDKEEVHIIPGVFNPVDALEYPGTKVMMKNRLPVSLQELKKRNLSVYMVENCGTENQKMYYSAEEIPEDAGYYSVMIIKEEKKK